jgi:hypothetical protein
MQYPNLFKRVIPFVAALLLGLGLANLLVGAQLHFPFGPPRIFERMRYMREDNYRLRMENEDLKQQLEEMRNGLGCESHFGRRNLLHTEALPAEDVPNADKELRKKTEDFIKKHRSEWENDK